MTKAKKHSGVWSDAFRRLRKNRAAMFGACLLLIFILGAVFADFITPYGFAQQDLDHIFEEPNSQHLLGTDDVGRDILSRILYGGRVSMTIGFISVSIGLVLGGSIGAIAGYYGGRLDNVIMRFMDILMAIPSTLLALVVAATLGPGMFNLMLAVGISSVPNYARQVRAATISVGKAEYIEAAKLSGCNDFQIILKHILPNCMATIIVAATLRMAYAILAASALSYLGLGVQPPQPEWGAMLSYARPFIRDHAYMIISPGIAIVCVILGFNLLGDGLRDALDPRLKN